MVNTQSIPASAPAQDPIFRNFTQISSDSPQIRWLTVYYGMYTVRGPGGRAISVPMLRLQGAWLERAGFGIGVPVAVHVTRGRQSPTKAYRRAISAILSDGCGG